MHVGQSIVSALEAVRESLVIDAEAMQDCGVEVVDVDGVFSNVVAEIVGFAVRDSGLDAATSHPD